MKLSQLLCVLATLAPIQATPAQVKKLYVEPFATASEAAHLRQDLTAELRKLHLVSLVPDESNADLVLGGGGEIWVRGYRSFSPRSPMKMPTNGTPIYGGFLSVELKNKRGATLWSDLVTPGDASGDIAKDLSKRIARHLADALNQPETPAPAAARPQAAVALKGAGATFPYPVYQKWFTNFQIENPGIAISYDAVGSEAGVRRLLDGSVDFGASDSPRAIHDLAPGQEGSYIFLPSVVGAVVPIVNVTGVPGDIAFTPEALAGIFLGKITRWNDPILRHANHRLHLPDLPIVVVHRSDGSGTSYAWTSYLSKASTAWNSSVGASLDPKWPVGRGAAGNDGVAKLVTATAGAIGYVEFIYALRNHLGYGRIRNQNGDLVQANLESIAAAVNQMPSDNLTASVVDAPGEGSYPIATFTWLVVPTHMTDATKRNAMVLFLHWMLGPGQRQAAALGYLPLPREIVAKEQDAISKIR